MDLTEQQSDALDRVMHWYKNGHDRQMVLAGYAGTGKTSLAKVIASEIEQQLDPSSRFASHVRFCAFTGKAANVLRDKGCTYVSTLHSAIYSVQEKSDRHLNSMIKELDQERNKATPNKAHIKYLQDNIEKEKENIKKPSFTVNPDSVINSAALVIVDEYSMLYDKLIEDLMSFGKKVLFIGDPFQLSPVAGSCSLEPNLFLTEVHRQAEESGIIRAATMIRNDQFLGKMDEYDFKFFNENQVPPNWYTDADQLIVGRNKTRTAWNQRFRRYLGFESELPESGDKMICLQNNHETGLYNGLIGYANNDVERNTDISYALSFSGFDKEFNVWDGDVLERSEHWNPKIDKRLRELERFDFGYAITCHKSQGSEFPYVLVYNQPVGSTKKERRRWLYTAITRASEQAVLVQPGR